MISHEISIVNKVIKNYHFVNNYFILEYLV